MRKERKILIASTEVVPFAKTGGLADVVSALPKALEKLGVEVSVVMPRYRCIDEKEHKLKRVGSSFSVPMAGEMVEVSLKTAKLNKSKVNVYFVECEKYFDRDGLYGENGQDYFDNDERFALFSRSVVEMMKVLKLKPEVVHCNDWQTGLIPAYLRTVYKDDTFFDGVSTVMTIHSVAYQGIFPKSTMEKIGLPWETFSADGVEYWDQVSYLKAGVVYADIINTVSPTYACEIQSSPYRGKGFEGLLSYRSGDFYGILNGVDYSVWSPEKDTFLASTYDESDLRGKNRNKKALQLSLIHI